MAQVDLAPQFGAELKDGFKPVNAWVCVARSRASLPRRWLTASVQVGGTIEWLADVEQFYRERSIIEKEYSGKLNALAKKYFEKRGRKSSSLSVGDTPVTTPGSLERFVGPASAVPPFSSLTVLVVPL